MMQWISLLAVLTTAAIAAEPELYKPKGQKAHDFWYARSGGTYYAFYLQRPDDAPHSATAVGEATSTDLLHWTEIGQVLTADPKAAWCNQRIATGSTWRGHDHWLMLFTAHGGTGGNVGLAQSDDLGQWTIVGPATIDYQDHVVPDDPYWQRQGLKAGEKFAYRIAADPYVLPDLIDGWFYMVANCQVVGRPSNQRGCVGLWRSRDGKTWEDNGVIALMLDYDRPETPQLWQHADRWYLYFGGAREGKELCRHNRLFSACSMQGPFEPPPHSEIKLPGYSRFFYIVKVLPDPQGHDVALAAVSGGAMSLPYPVTYSSDGSVELATPLLPETRKSR